jgi:hypothetical protein
VRPPFVLFVVFLFLSFIDVEFMLVVQLDPPALLSSRSSAPSDCCRHHHVFPLRREALHAWRPRVRT